MFLIVSGVPSLKFRCFSPPPLDLRSLFAAAMPEYPAMAPALAPTAPGSRAAADSTACCSFGFVGTNARVLACRILRHGGGGGGGDADPCMILVGLAMAVDGAACCPPWASSPSRGSACEEDSEASSPAPLLSSQGFGASMFVLLCITCLALLRVALSRRDDADTAASIIPRGTVRTAASTRLGAPDCCQPPPSADGVATCEHAAGEQVLSTIMAAAMMEIATLSHARPLLTACMALPKVLVGLS